ncbi:MAG: RICIN domain-containing protein [Polyangiales bacterium]
MNLHMQITISRRARSLSLIILAAVALITVTSLRISRPFAQPVANFSGELRGLGRKCLDVRGPSTSNGTPVQLWDCVGVPQQRWTLTSRGEVRGLGGKCLDVRGPSTDNGTPVQLWDCVSVPQQRWTLTPAGELRGLGGKCLDVRGPSTNNGTPVQLWDCVGVPQQHWVLIGRSAGGS